MKSMVRSAARAVGTFARTEQSTTESNRSMALLAGKTALITGGSRGIGRGIVERFLEEGADVAFTYVSSPEKANALAAELATKSGRKVMAIQSDAGNFEHAQKAVDEVVSAWGRLDVLVNNAGITKDGLAMRMSDEDWQSVIDVNLTATFRLCRAAIRGMMKARWGRIVNISSVVGTTGNAGQVNYAASKAGMVGLSKSLAAEVASRGITVNCVAPGFIETAMTEKLNETQRAAILGSVPAGRMGSPQEIAAAALLSLIHI